VLRGVVGVGDQHPTGGRAGLLAVRHPPHPVAAVITRRGHRIRVAGLQGDPSRIAVTDGNSDDRSSNYAAVSSTIARNAMVEP
jgi:hypothetical protein